MLGGGHAAAVAMAPLAGRHRLGGAPAGRRRGRGAPRPGAHSGPGRRGGGPPPPPRPLLVTLEDLHWSAPVSVLVAGVAAEAAAALPLMLLLTCRDEQDEATPQVRDRLPAAARTRARRRVAA